MAQFPKPWFRADRGLWYVQLHGRQHNLGRDQGEAFRRYHALMHRPPEVVAHLVCGVVEAFLEWCQRHRSPLTYRWYRDRLQSFCTSLPDPREFTVAGLKPFHVEQWADAHPSWGDSQRRGAIAAVQRAFFWAEKRGHILQSPVRHVEKPEAATRETVVSETEYRSLLARYEGDPFRDVLEFAWETGARPQEIVVAEARHVNVSRERIEYPRKESKGKKRWRVIYLSSRALEIVRRLIVRHPEGKLFRTRRGTAFTAWSVNSRMCRLQESVGKELLRQQGFRLDPDAVQAFAATLAPTVKEKGTVRTKTDAERLREARKKLLNKEAHKVGRKLCMYNFRHTFATRLLEAGCDSITVQALLGHVPGSNVLSKVYSHIGKSNDFLREELRKAVG